jgi:hypothetical protein
VDREEALTVANSELTRHRDERHDALARLVDNPEWSLACGPSGQEYEVQLHAVWDDGRVGGNLRVIASVGDRTFQRFISPLSTDFIVSPDGDFIGE